MKMAETVREGDKFSNFKKCDHKINAKGITLIALIVTIIVLLILVGVTIATLTGENGLLNRASTASKETEKQTATEKINLKITNIQIDTYAKKQMMPTLQDLADAFCEDNDIEYIITKNYVASKEKIDVTGFNSIYTKLSEYPYEFEIDSSLRLASIDGVKIADNNSTNNEEIDSLKTLIAQNQQKISELENSLTETKSELEITKSNVENLAVSAITRETLFEGTAGTQGSTYTIKDISSYKYIIVYTDCLNADKTVRVTRSSNIINVSDIVYNNSTTLQTNTLFGNTGFSDANTNYSVLYWFKSSTEMFIHNIKGNIWESPRIYKIEGIK